MRAAQVTVVETTGISATLGIPSVCVDRSDWAQARSTASMPVLTALAGALQRTERRRARRSRMPAPAVWKRARTTRATSGRS